MNNVFKAGALALVAMSLAACEAVEQEEPVEETGGGVVDADEPKEEAN